MVAFDQEDRSVSQVRMNAVAFTKLIEALQMGGHTILELAEYTGLHLKTIYAYTKALYEADQIHIEAWTQDKAGRTLLRIYKLGAGRDAKRTRVPRAESQRRWRSKRDMLALASAISS